MLKKIIFSLSIIITIVIFFIGIYLYQYLNSDIIKSIKKYKDINILFTIKNDLNKENINFKFLIVKYSLLNKYTKVLFVNENITILQKNIKSRTLNDMILSVKENKQLDFAKLEIEKLLNNKLKIDYYLLLDIKNLKTIIKLFSKGKDIEKNLILTDIYLNKNTDRTNTLSSSMKLINYIKANINIFNYIGFIKYLKNNIVFLETNFNLKDIIFLYKCLNDDKIIRYADIPTLHKRNRIEPDEINKSKIINFLNNNNKPNNKLQLKIFNATDKKRLALKATNKLRKNNFDVIEWENFKYKYNWTIIFDLVDDYEQIKKIKNVLGCGEIIFVPNNLLLTQTTVFLGQDCKIYDKLDRYTYDD